MTAAVPPTVDLPGARLHALTERQVVEHVLAALDGARGGFIVTLNLDHLRRCVRDAGYRDLVARADLAVADGVPLLWATRIAGTPLPGLVAGSNLISSLAAGAAGRARSVYLLGGVPGTADGAAHVLASQSPGLRIAGTQCPPLGFESDAEEMARIRESLAAASPDVVFVALGSPKQEILINRIRSVLPRAWWVGVGISFSYLAGDVRRAPVWMRGCGLEWLHRVASEPRRLARRYLVEGIPFGIRVMSWALARRLLSWSVGTSSRPRSPDAPASRDSN